MKRSILSAGTVRTLLCLLILSLCNGCYLIKQGVNLFSYQMRSRPIQRLMRDTTLSAKNRDFFKEIERIRAYAADSIGLVRNKNYTRYVTIDRNYLVAVLSAADSTSFTPKKWCYPFFGCFPLRGYYDIRDAKRAGERLAGKGNEINIDEVDGFSTLGIFSDPLYSFMADYSPFALAHFIFHEQTHATVFFKNVQFSEEFATFVAREAALRYLKSYYGPDSPTYQKTLKSIVDQQTYLKLLRTLYTDLGAVYRQNISRTEKLKRKKVIVDRFKQRLVDDYDSLFTTQWYHGVEKNSFNNAFLAVRMTYTLDLGLFERLYQQQGNDLRGVVRFVAGLKKKKGDPKKHLEAAIPR
jgi:predicted aminopeptidase